MSATKDRVITTAEFAANVELVLTNVETTRAPCRVLHRGRVVVISLRMNLSSSTISTPRLIRGSLVSPGRSSELAADALEDLVVDRVERLDHARI